MSDPEPQPSARPWPRVSRLRVAGPVVLIVAALVAAGAVATVHESNAPTSSSATANPGGAARGRVGLVGAPDLRGGRQAREDG